MQAENNKNNIQTVIFGCRLNSLEAAKIQNILCPVIKSAILVNTCAVTGEAERQCGQAVRRLARENPDTPIFVTGCAATRNPGLFAKIPNTFVIDNRDKMRVEAYISAIGAQNDMDDARAPLPQAADKMSKQFIQIQNGCNHDCTYCVTRLLRGPGVSFEYSDILGDVRAAVDAGHSEIVLTGVDIASYARTYDGRPFLISDLCRQILSDVPGVRRLRLSSMDPASPEVLRIIDLIHSDARMMPHMHLSMQSGCDEILRPMRRRHTAQMVRDIVARADGITFSWDIICGFPGETDAHFETTMQLVRDTKPIKIHAFPFSPRPGTVAADMPAQVDRAVSKARVRKITAAAGENLGQYMRGQIGKTVPVLVENNNTARTPDDIAVRITGAPIPARTVCDVVLGGIDGDTFIAQRA